MNSKSQVSKQVGKSSIKIGLTVSNISRANTQHFKNNVSSTAVSLHIHNAFILKMLLLDFTNGHLDYIKLNIQIFLLAHGRRVRVSASYRRCVAQCRSSSGERIPSPWTHTVLPHSENKVNMFHQIKFIKGVEVVAYLTNSFWVPCLPLQLNRQSLNAFIECLKSNVLNLNWFQVTAVRCVFKLEFKMNLLSIIATVKFAFRYL